MKGTMTKVQELLDKVPGFAIRQLANLLFIDIKRVQTQIFMMITILMAKPQLHWLPWMIMYSFVTSMHASCTNLFCSPK